VPSAASSAENIPQKFDQYEVDPPESPEPEEEAEELER
jgi:hypothetical protein